MSLKSSIMQVINNAVLAVRGTTVREALNPPAAAMVKPAARTAENQMDYNPDFETEEALKPVLNPVIAFHEALRANGDKKIKMTEGNPFKGRNVRVAEAWVFEGKCTEAGKLLRDRKVFEALRIFWPAPHRIRHVQSHDDYMGLMESARKEWSDMPVKRKSVESRQSAKRQLVKRLSEARLLTEGFADFDFSNDFDPNQYTEFAPLMAGPFNKQLYLTDYLRMHSLAFEAWNHNPIAKRCVELLSQYTFGRRFKVRIKDAAKDKAWKDFNEKNNIREHVSQYWVREYCIYGEIMLNNENWQLVDPSTVWDIITDPDNIRDVYYYYQSYPTAYQMFTGYTVAGEPGSAQVRSEEFIVRQIPAHKIIHIRGNCVSNEKRGRSLLFPILGWLKRIKDLYNAVVLRQWLMSCFIWDDTVKGNAADIAAHAAQYSTMPKAGSTFVHNESVERKPMPAIESASRGSASGVGEEIIAFIATAIGIPKEFLNVITSGGGSRATALTSAEPFTKVIEDIQAKFEALLIIVAKYAFAEAGLTYEEGDVEFIFPSVTKDTTTETIKNIGTGEALGYISKQTAAEMYAGEMNITNYEFEKEQSRISGEAKTGMNKLGNTTQIPAGRFGGGEKKILDTDIGDTSGAAGGGDDDDDSMANPKSPIHGSGKVSLSRSLKRI